MNPLQGEWGFLEINLCFLESPLEKNLMSESRRKRRAIQFRHSANFSLGGITIAGIGVRQTVAVAKPRVFGQYALVYILEGRGRYNDAYGWQQDLRSGDFILVFPELSHLYNPNPGTSWVTSFLCFQGPIFDLLRESGVLNPRRPVLHLEPVNEWSRHIESVLGASRKAGQLPSLIETARLIELLAMALSDPGRVPREEEDRRWAQRACSVLEARLNEAAAWRKIARQFGLNEDAFRKRFARLVGQPPARYRSRVRIDRACEMMVETRLTDSQIAECLGFCDEFYFSRRFKEITGKSPQAFRRSLLVFSQNKA